MIKSKFLRQEDIEDDVILTMKDVTLEEMPGDENEKRWVLTFREIPKGLVLNATVIRVLEKHYGHHSDEWIGRKVTLYRDESIQFKGKTMGGLRLRPFKGKGGATAMATPPASAAPAASVPINDADAQLP
jgi:hypothetical protein